MRVPWRVTQALNRFHRWRARFSQPLQLDFSDAGNGRIEIVAAGDISITQSIAELYRSGSLDAVCGPALGWLQQADLRVGNLESQIVGDLPQYGENGSFLRADANAVGILRDLNFDVVTVANNHCLDFGSQGLAHSVQQVQKTGIATTGYQQDGTAAAAACVERGGVRMGFLSYCDDFRGDSAELVKTSPVGFDVNVAIREIQDLKKRVDIVVVQLHWGYEFQLFPMQHHRDQARAMADAGADVVLCHHAHVPMGVERWGSALIAHGLGNFIFRPDQYVIDGNPLSQTALLLRVELSKSGVAGAELAGFAINPNGSLSAFDKSEQRWFQGIMGSISRGLGDDAKIAKLTEDRLAAEAQSLIRSLCVKNRSTASCSELANTLLVPRQQWLLAWMGQHESSAVRAAENTLSLLLEAVKHDSAPTIRAMCANHALWKQHASELASALGSFGELPGTTP